MLPVQLDIGEADRDRAVNILRGLKPGTTCRFNPTPDHAQPGRIISVIFIWRNLLYCVSACVIAGLSPVEMAPQWERLEQRAVAHLEKLK